MEFPRLSNIIAKLSTTQYKEASQELVKELESSEHGEVSETQLGSFRKDLKYTLDRLLKGLQGTAPSKKGFSYCLSQVFAHFPEIQTQNVLSYHSQLDHSLISKKEILHGKILAFAAVLKAKKQVTEASAMEIIEVFKTKENLRQEAAEALAQLPDLKKLYKKIPNTGDANYFMLSCSLSPNPESVVVQAVQSKNQILQTVYKSLPQLHPVCGLMIEAAKASNKTSYLWHHLVDKQLSESKKTKPYQFAFEFMKALLAKGEVSAFLTQEFINLWHENLYTKGLSLNQSALEAKKVYLEKLDQVQDFTEVAKQLLELVPSLKSLDLVKLTLEKAIHKGSAINLILDKTKKFKQGKPANLAILCLHQIALTENAPVKSIERLLGYCSDPQLADLAKVKVLQACSTQSISFLKQLKFDSFELSPQFKKLQKKLLKKTQTQETQEKLGKRKAGELKLLTDSQLQALTHLNLVLAIEGLLFGNLEDATQLYKLLKSLVSKKDCIQEVFLFLLHQCTKPASYIRKCLKKTFKAIVDLVPEEFVQKITEMIKTGKVELEIQEPEEQVETSEDLSEILNQPKEDLKKQISTMKSHFIIRASDFLEVLINNTKSYKDWVKVYKAIYIAYKKNQKTKDLASKCLKLLQKLKKTDLDLTCANPEEVQELIGFISGAILKQKQLGLSKNFIALCKISQSIKPGTDTEWTNHMVRKYFTNHNCKVPIGTLKEVLNNLTTDQTTANLLVEYSQNARNTTVKLDAIELLKSLCKKHQEKDQLWKQVTKVLNKTTKEDLKPNLKNKLLRNLLACLLILRKDSNTGKKSQVEKLSKKLQEIKTLKGVLTQLTGTFN